MSMLGLSLRILKLRNVSAGVVRLVHERPPEYKRKKGYTKASNRDSDRDSDEEQKINGVGYFLLSVPVITFMLGTWQVNRRKWKLNLMEDLNKRMNSPAQPLPEDLSELEKLEYCPIKVRGEFLYDKEFKVGPRSLIVGGAGVSEKGGGVFTGGGSTGYCIVTPFKLENRDTIILINRGWLRKGSVTEAHLAHVPGVQELTGVVRLNERRSPLMPKNSSGSWTYRDLKSMAEMTGADPVYLDLIASDGAPGGPIAGQTRVTLRNEHLSYIVTWYSLSVITAWMWHRQFIKKLPIV